MTDNETSVALATAISLERVGKRYGNTQALREITVEIAAGSVVGLVGENGAGKSTLVRLLSGSEQPTTGLLGLHGEIVNGVGSKAVYERGVRVVFQEGSLIDQLPLYENLVLYERTAKRSILFDRKSAIQRTRDVLRTLNIDPDVAIKPVAELSPSERQIAEVGRCLIDAGSIAILDEPTSSLSKQGARRVLDAVHRLGRAGTTVIYVSHILEEVLEVCDRVLVFRDGELVGDRGSSDWELPELVNTIVGREGVIAGHNGHRQVDGQVSGQSEVDGLRSSVVALRDVNFRSLHDIHLEVHPGEILGIAGIGGSGKSMLGRLIAGREPFQYNGSFEIMGRQAKDLSRKQVMRRVGYLPSDRARDGLNLRGSVGHNLMMGKRPHGGVLIRRSREDAITTASLKTYRVRCRGASDPIVQLSGGNQQKVLLARAYLGAPDIVVLDEPTRGIDVGARNEIYEQIRSRAAEGIATVVISNEPEEIAALANRAVIMQRGEIVSELPCPTREDIYEATVS